VGLERGNEMNKHDQARFYLIRLNDQVDPNAFQNEYAIIDNYINEAEATEKELEEMKGIHDYYSLYLEFLRLYNEEKVKREELQQDVDRYFELDNRYAFSLTEDEQIKSNKLRDKLSKGGVNHE